MYFRQPLRSYYEYAEMETVISFRRSFFALAEFCLKNYLRQHRYILDLVAIVIFSVFFGAFLTSGQLEDSIWLTFSALALILNFITSPALFFFEKGNTLHFLLSKPNGRRNLFLAKITVIVFIDLFWVTSLALLYGLRYLSVDYFLWLPLRLSLIALMLLLSTTLMSFAYTFRPQISWLIFVVVIFGCIVKKAALFPIESAGEILKVLALALPPFFELILFSVALQPHPREIVFLIIAAGQAVLWGGLSWILLKRKDLV